MIPFQPPPVQTPEVPDWFAQNAPPPSAPSTPGTSSAPNTQDPQAYFNSLFPGTSLSPQQLLAQEAELQKAGIKVLKNAAGVAGKIQLPNGQIIDVIQGAGAGQNIKQWLTGDGAAGGGQGVGLGGDFGSFAQGFQDKFHAPTIDEIRATPGYQFARDEGIKALDTRAAAMGTVNNGGQKKEILDFATGLADQTGHQRYTDALSEYKLAHDILSSDRRDIFGRFDALAQRGTNAANAATS